MKDKAIEEHRGIWFLEHFEWGCCPPLPSLPLPVHEGQGLDAGGKTSSADKSVGELSRVVLMRLKHLVGWIPNFIQLSKIIFCITSCMQGMLSQKCYCWKCCNNNKHRSLLTTSIYWKLIMECHSWKILFFLQQLSANVWARDVKSSMKWVRKVWIDCLFFIFPYFNPNGLYKSQ